MKHRGEHPNEDFGQPVGRGKHKAPGPSQVSLERQELQTAIGTARSQAIALGMDKATVTHSLTYADSSVLRVMGSPLSASYPNLTRITVNHVYQGDSLGNIGHVFVTDYLLGEASITVQNGLVPLDEHDNFDNTTDILPAIISQADDDDRWYRYEGSQEHELPAAYISPNLDFESVRVQRALAQDLIVKVLAGLSEATQDAYYPGTEN